MTNLALSAKRAIPGDQLLSLATLDSRPSWLNRAGRIDRSACFELRASDVWPLANLRPTPSRPFRRPYLETSGGFTLTTPFLLCLRDRRLPRTLIGDWRTSKSNAMKDHRSRKRQPPAQRLGTLDFGLTANPNKGAAATKLLGLPLDGNFNSANPAPGTLDPTSPSAQGWSQLVRIERHRLHASLAQHFLICPACGKKYLKLFLPLCTRDEIRDADLAHTFLRSHFPQLFTDSLSSPSVPRSLSPLVPSVQSLLSRYSLLFPPRRLLCRHCLGLRYGEVKKNRRRRS